MSEKVALKDPYTEKRIYVARVAVAGLGVVVMLVLLGWRYFSLQIQNHEAYRTQSERNRVQLQPIPPKRGLIYDTQGVLLAENIPSYSLTIVKEHVTDLEQTLVLLQQLLAIDKEDINKFKKRLRRRRPYQAVPLKFRLTEVEIAKLAVNRYRLPGVDVDARLTRSYPLDRFFAHALGYVGRISEYEQLTIDPVNYSGTDHIGKIGLEKYYEDILHGQVGYQNVEANARGRVLRVLERTNPEPGQDIHLYLDAQVQRVAQEALSGRKGSVVAIDPKTGGILALVSTPSFDPNLFVNGISRKDYSRLRDSVDLPLFNRSLQGQYPPGSTVKPIMALAGLDFGVVTAQTTISDPGWYQLPNDDRRYRDWKKAGHGTQVDLNYAMLRSCDVYFYDLAYKLGIDRIHRFAELFGLGEKTGIDNTNERSGLLPSREWKRKFKRQAWFPGESLNIGIGQGYMLMTPLQLAVSTAVIARRGERYIPRLLKSIDNKEIPVPSLPPIQLSDEYWDLVINGMKNVVHHKSGTAKIIAKGMTYKMAGKTGTAQVVGIAQTEEYDESLLLQRHWDHALFVGFAPLEDPQIAVAVIVENGQHGGSTAGPIARKVLDQYLLQDTPQ